MLFCSVSSVILLSLFNFAFSTNSGGKTTRLKYTTNIQIVSLMPEHSSTSSTFKNVIRLESPIFLESFFTFEVETKLVTGEVFVSVGFEEDKGTFAFLKNSAICAVDDQNNILFTGKWSDGHLQADFKIPLHKSFDKFTIKFNENFHRSLVIKRIAVKNNNEEIGLKVVSLFELKKS